MHVEQTRAVWLGPLRSRLDARTARKAAADDENSDEGEDESDGAWQAVEFALEGVERVLKTF